MTQRKTVELNLEMLQMLQGIPGEKGPSLLVEVIDAYLHHSPEIIKGLRDSIEKNDYEAAREYAHKLKGSSMNLGADTVGKICSELESLAKTGSLTGAGELLTQACETYEQTRELLLKDWRKAA